MPHHKSGNGLLIHSIQGQHNLLALHKSNTQRYPFLLESVSHPANNHQLSQFDILFAFPQETLCLTNKNTLNGIDNLDGFDFLDNLDLWWTAESDNKIQQPGYLPFCGGWFLYLGYELANQIETRLRLTMPESDIAYATRIPAAIIYDHCNDMTFIICEQEFEQHHPSLIEDCHNIKNNLGEGNLNSITLHEDDPDIYLNAIKEVKKYITDGDVFQVNLSRMWESENISLNPADLYAALCKANPAPFAGLVQYKDVSIICSSPERLIKVTNGIAETRPIAGTRKRGDLPAEDHALQSELIANDKERAEHVMLIDLERNDLGRLCEPGSIEVDDFMTVESYAHVHHIVSNIKGKLKAGTTPGQVIRAVFPGGTITGCPKERCMAIISELEQGPRGAYTGSIGYLNHNGNMDLNILIRSMTYSQQKIRFRAGAGLVADSVASSELHETRHKAHGLLLALS